MSSFPKNESEIVALADQMVAGLTTHGADFPSLTVAELTTELNAYKADKVAQENTKGQLQIATTTKDEELDSLVILMKNFIKKAEVDCTYTPEKLVEIGWGTRQTPTPILAPGVPTLLRSIAESPGEIWLAWDKPASESGGLVRNYLVERCEKLPDGNFGPWILVATVYNNEAHVIEQPSNARLIYRVKAANAAGQSGPSNTILVVLP